MSLDWILYDLHGCVASGPVVCLVCWSFVFVWKSSMLSKDDHGDQGPMQICCRTPLSPQRFPEVQPLKEVLDDCPTSLRLHFQVYECYLGFFCMCFDCEL